MKLPADKLPAQLARQLAPLYILSCDEPLLVDEALTLIRERAAQDGCGERETHVAERGFDWGGLDADLQNMSLFASRRFVELRLPGGKPGEDGARFLTALASRPDTGNVIVLVLPRLDSATSRSKWAGALADGGVWVDLRAPHREQLVPWLRQRLKKVRLKADDEALEILAARVEGNLLAAKQEIDKLALLLDSSKVVTADAMREAVADGARFDVFQLADAALSRDAPRALRILDGLEREGEPAALVLWSLVREVLNVAEIVARTRGGCSIGQAMQEVRVWSTRQQLYERAVRGRGLEDARRLVSSAANAEKVVKGARPGDAWRALTELVLALSGTPAVLAETA